MPELIIENGNVKESVQHCPDCDEALPEAFTYCPYCGVEL